MFENINNDVDALRIHLNEQKIIFDRSIREGLSFELVKKIYLEIKELECQIGVMELTANNNPESVNHSRHSSVDEPPTML